MAKRLRLGLDTYSYHFAAAIWPPSPPEPLTLEGYLDRAADLGVDGLALADMGHFESAGDQEVRRIKTRARARGLYVELGTGGSDVDHLRYALRLARRFGTSVLRTFVSIGKTWSPAGHYESALPTVADALRDAARTCEETRVALAVENHQDLTAGELAELLDRVDHPLVGACWDTGNSFGVLEDPLEGLAMLAERTFTVHLKSYAVMRPPAESPGAGYVLVGVPPEHNGRMLRETVAALARSSPAEELHINLEAAVEYIPVTPGRRGWRPEYAQAAEAILRRADGKRTTPEGIEPWIPRKDMSLEEVLSLEERLVAESARQARRMLAEFA